MKRVGLHKLISFLAGVSLAFNSLVPSGAVALACQAECSEDNIIVNGSFEEPIVTNEANWDIFGSPNFVPGWQADWRDAEPTVWQTFQRPAPQIELQKGVNSWVAQERSQWTELDADWDGPSGSLNGEPASIKLWQDITTVPGANYEIKFYTSPRPGINEENTEARFGDSVLGVITTDGTTNTNTVWTEHIYTVAAVAATTRLMFTDLGTANSLGGFLDNVSVSRICEPEPDPCDFGKKTGWYGEYFNYSQSHLDMNLDSSKWPDKTHGDPMSKSAPWTADWYTQQYFRFSRVDANLAFGENFFPFDGTNGATPLEEDNGGGRDYHFGTHWSAKVTAPADGDYMFNLKTDDDAWVYLDGVLVADNSGIHPPASINDKMTLTTAPKILDVYFAERHTVQSHMYFAFAGDIFPQIVPYNRACPQPVPTLTLEKTGEYNMETNRIDYAINWELTEEGTLTNVTITDTIPTGTTFESADNGGIYDIPTRTVTWLLGPKTAPATGAVHFVVSVDSSEPWADTVVDYNPGLQKGGGALPGDRIDPSKALGFDTDTDAEPINFVSLGFGGDIVLGFNNYIINGTGPDIHVIETSYGNLSGSSYPEKLEVLASQNGSTWVSLGIQTRSETVQDNDFDLSGSGLIWAQYLKLVDKTDPANFPNDADGYDVAGVQAVHSGPAECMIDNTANITGLSFEQKTISASATTTTPINQVACRPEKQDVKVIAHKIVCDSEVDLPNWGEGGHGPITSTTAQDFVTASQGRCHFQPNWKFEWGQEGSGDPGDILVGPAGGTWTPFGPTNEDGRTEVNINEVTGSQLEFREVLQTGYIPFSHEANPDNSNNISAEFYCSNDVLNYDNWDFIRNPILGQTYNCVGFNTPSAHTVSGMKFNDKDGDGTKDDGDNGLAKWTIYASKFIQTIQVAAQNTIPTSPEFLTDELTDGKEYILRVSGTFDANDYITADAKYSMRSVDGPDWTDTVKNYLSYGPTLLDLFIDNVAPNWGVYNPSHVYWRTITGTGAQVKLQIYEIYAQNDSGALTVDVYEVIDKQITNDEGNYHFTFPNDIGEVIISEQTQDGWLETLPSPQGYYSVSTGSNYTDKDFGNHYTVQLPGSVTGMKFDDHDGDGTKDVNDGGLSGWKIYAGQLQDTLEVNSYYEDPEVPALSQSNFVLENGQKYFLRVSQTFLAGDSITADAKYSIRSGPDWTDVVENYGGWEPALLELWMNSTIVNWGAFNTSHVYWHTVIGDGNVLRFHIKDIWPINNQGKLKVEVFKVVAEATTVEGGTYNLVLPDELTGEVVVAEETKEGWTQTYPMPLGYYTVSADGLTEGKNFGNHDTTTQDDGGEQIQTGSISGMKFEDHDGDRVKDSEDGPLADWTIYIDTNDDGNMDFGEPPYMTGQDGIYQFNNLVAGTYVIREVGNPPKWTQTYPASGAHTLVLGGDTWIWAGINFGNHEEGEGVNSQGENGTGGGGGGGGYSTVPTTGEESSNDEEGVGGGDVAGDEDVSTPAGSPTVRPGGRQVALGTGATNGEEGNVQQQGNISGDQVTNDENTDDQSGGWGGWKTFGIISISLLLLLLILYGIYKWTNRKGKASGSAM